jgi:parvulin-like peptidyl-prolyl isomerase
MKLQKLKYGLLFLLLAGLLFLASCKGGKTGQEPSGFDLGDPQKKNNIILKVEDSFYFNSDFEKYIRATLGDDYSSSNVVSLSRLLDSFIEEKMLFQAAQNQKVALTWEEKKEYLAKLANEFKSDSRRDSLEELDTKILFDRLIIQKYTYELVKGIEVKTEEIKEYYQLHKREFLRPERVKVSQILLETEDKAVEIYEGVKNASEESFRKIAQAESVGLEAGKGGEMGVFEMGQLPFEMEKAIFSLKEGEVSQVVESSYGYHIFRLDKRYEPELISEEKAAPGIKVKILNQKIKKRISEQIEDLKNSMEWNFYPQNLSFPYQRNGS